MGSFGKKEIKSLALLTLITFLFLMGVTSTWSVIGPMFLAFECDQRGIPADTTECNKDKASQAASANHLTYLFVAGYGANFLTVSLFGVLADNYNRKLPMAIAACGQCLAAYVTVAVPLDKFGLYYTLQTLVNLTGGYLFFQSAVFSIVADVTSEFADGLRLRVFGIFEAIVNIGMMAGPMMGGIIASSIGHKESFVFCTACCGIVSLIVLAFLPNTQQNKKMEKFNWTRGNPIGAVKLIASKTVVWKLMLITLFAFSAMSGSFSCFGLFLPMRFSFKTVNVGVFQTVLIGSIAMGLLFLLPIIQRKVEKKRILFWSLLYLSIVISGYALSTEKWEVWFIAVLQFPANFYLPQMRTTITDVFGAHQYGEALAALATTMGFIQIVGPTVFTQIYSVTQDLPGLLDGSVFFVCALIMLAACLLTLTLPRLEDFKHHPDEKASLLQKDSKTGAQKAEASSYSALLSSEKKAENQGVSEA